MTNLLPEVRLSMKECRKLEVLEEVRAGQRSQVSAAAALHVTDRWIRSLLSRLAERGAAGLAHGNRGRVSPRRASERIRNRIIQLYQDRYEDFNLTHFGEMLRDREGMQPPSRETLRNILMVAGIWARRRKVPPHRLRRPRREHEGELLQVDASIHPWLGEDASPIALVGAVDDATGDVPYASFFEAETTEAYFKVLRGIIVRRGVPKALYGDRDSVFVVNDPKEREEVQTRGGVARTQFGRALDELGIEWITAYSPQAKGRIERVWGIFQDRLLKELRAEGIRRIIAANDYLLRRFLPTYARRFRRPAAAPNRLYGPCIPARQMDGILCWKETRTLGRDHTFRWEGQAWQVMPCDRVPALSGRRVEVRRTLRGTIEAWHEDVRLRLRRAPQTPPLARFALPAGLRSLAAAFVPGAKVRFG